jgi:hypothetical protein
MGTLLSNVDEPRWTEQRDVVQQPETGARVHSDAADAVAEFAAWTADHELAGGVLHSLLEAIGNVLGELPSAFRSL